MRALQASPSNIVFGEFTIDSDTDVYTVTHNKGVLPALSLCYIDNIGNNYSGYAHLVSIGMYRDEDNHPSATSYNNFQGNPQPFMANYGGVREYTDNTVTFNARGGSYVFKAGALYHYILIFRKEGN